MNNFTKRLIPIAQAQIIDAIAQPSFGNLSNDSSQNRTLARIDLTPTTNITDLKVGDTFTIGVNIKTFEEVTLNKIALKISFDKTKFSVIDSNPNVSGTQIKITNTNFYTESDQDNLANNSDGTITLIISSDEPVDFSEGGEIATITFNAQSAGSSKISVVSGSQGTKLFSDSKSVAYLTSELQLNTKTSSGNITPNISPTVTQITSSPTPTILPTLTIENRPVEQIPNTSISDISLLVYIFIGVIFMLIGLWLSKSSNKNSPKF